MQRANLFITLAIVLSISACKRHDDKPPVNILEGQHQALEKARQVDQMLQKAAEEQRRTIDADTGGSTSSDSAQQSK